MTYLDVTPPRAEALASALRSIGGTTEAKTRVDVPISTMTSFRVGGVAKMVIEPQSDEELRSIGLILQGQGISCLVIGRGSNVLVSDMGFPGAVIRLGKRFDWIEGQGREVRCGASASFPQVANWAARRSLEGLEFAVAIPASVGGAVRMNAGAHGSSVDDVLQQATIVDMAEGNIEQVGNYNLSFGYRKSRISWSQVVVSAVFHLASGEREDITERMDEYRDHRSRTQPSDAPNAGSMFRNLDDRSAGSLIEGCGLKGYAVGNAQISQKHANFFLAHPGAKAQDIFDLMVKAQSTVFEATGDLLVPEVQIVGRFEGIERLRFG